MRSLAAMDTVQVEVTNACVRSCSNCTRFCGHHHKPYFMPIEQFAEAVDAMIGYPKMVGMMGGEPLLHPQFTQLCQIMRDKIPKRQLGLWTSLPEGYEHYREAICETFDHIFINDHSRNDIYHAPILVSIEEILPNERDIYGVVNDCWIQNYWSAAINPKGAWFCEIAASLSLLLDGPMGWQIERDWWKRVPKDFTSQCEWACPQCGAAVPLPRRVSTDGRDDISPKMLEKLKGKSRKVDNGMYVISNLQTTQQPEQMAAYKDFIWRKKVSNRYGIHLVVNTQRFLTPILSNKFPCDNITSFNEYMTKRVGEIT